MTTQRSAPESVGGPFFSGIRRLADMAEDDAVDDCSFVCSLDFCYLPGKKGVGPSPVLWAMRGVVLVRLQLVIAARSNSSPCVLTCDGMLHSKIKFWLAGLRRYVRTISGFAYNLSYQAYNTYIVTTRFLVLVPRKLTSAPLTLPLIS